MARDRFKRYHDAAKARGGSSRDPDAQTQWLDFPALRYAGKCVRCGRWLPAGTKAQWRRGADGESRVRCVPKCRPKPKPRKPKQLAVDEPARRYSQTTEIPY